MGPAAGTDTPLVAGIAQSNSEGGHLQGETIVAQNFLLLLKKTIDESSKEARSLKT